MQFFFVYINLCLQSVKQFAKKLDVTLHLNLIHYDILCELSEKTVIQVNAKCLVDLLKLT